MDIQRFRHSRDSELSDFRKQYNFLKTQYSSVLTSAIQENDPQSQQNLIQQVLQINSSLADELRSIISKLNQGSEGFNPKELSQLTSDLIQYQKDYAELEQSRDKVNTLKLIRESNNKKINSASFIFNIYIAIFVALSFIVAYLVFKTEWMRQLSSIIPTPLRQ